MQHTTSDNAPYISKMNICLCMFWHIGNTLDRDMGYTLFVVVVHRRFVFQYFSSEGVHFENPLLELLKN